MRIRSGLLLALLGGLPALQAEILYTVTNLGTLGGDASYSWAINNAGQVTGWSLPLHDTWHAFLYSDGQMRDLGALGGGESYGNDINNAGQVTGYYVSSAGSHPYRAFLYSNGQMRDLGTVSGDRDDYISIGTGINDSGQVTGWDTLGAFLYSNGQMKSLGMPSATPQDINNLGQVVGQDNGRAFLYSNGQGIDLGTLGGRGSSAIRINDSGQVTGDSQISTSSLNQHAFLYSNGQMIDLGTLGGDFSSGRGINNVGQVVGFSALPTGIEPHAFLYQNGQMYDLNDLIDPALNITLQFAIAINDNGQIVVNSASDVRHEPSFLLTPIPEPSTLALFGVALLGLGVWARRRNGPERYQI